MRISPLLLPFILFHLIHANENFVNFMQIKVLSYKNTNSPALSLTHIIPSHLIRLIEFSCKLMFAHTNLILGSVSCKLRFRHTNFRMKLIPFAHTSFLLMQAINPSSCIVDYSFHPIHPILFFPSNSFSSSHLVPSTSFIPSCTFHPILSISFRSSHNVHRSHPVYPIPSLVPSSFCFYAYYICKYFFDEIFIIHLY